MTIIIEMIMPTKSVNNSLEQPVNIILTLDAEVIILVLSTGWVTVTIQVA